MNRDGLEKTRVAFGERLSALQGEMTSTDLASAMHMSRNQLYLLRSGQSGTTVETVRRFTEVFGMTDRAEIEELYRLAGFISPDLSADLEGRQTLYATIGGRLHEARKRSGFSAEDVADYLGVPVATYAGYESGAIAIPLADMVALAKRLKRPIDWIVGNSPELDEDEEELLAFYRDAAPHMQGAARLLLRAAVREEDASETTHGKKAI